MKESQYEALREQYESLRRKKERVEERITQTRKRIKVLCDRARALGVKEVSAASLKAAIKEQREVVRVLEIGVKAALKACGIDE